VLIGLVLRDLRYAARRLAASPTFSAVSILVLGSSLGIGTSLFGLLNSLVLRSAGFESTPGLIRIAWGPGGREVLGGILPQVVSDQLFTAEFQTVKLAGYSRDDRDELVVSSSGQAKRTLVEEVVGHYFEVVEANPVAGRLLSLEDNDLAAPPVVVVSERFWRAWQVTDGDLLNRTIRVSGEPRTVVGVVSAGFQGVALRGVPTDLWVPARRNGVGHAFGRIKDHVRLEQVDAEIRSRVRLGGRYVDYVVSAKPGILPPLPFVAQVFTAASFALCAVLVAVAGSSVANLCLARLIGRRSEFAVRLMLGASGGDLHRLIYAELGIIGAGAAILSLLASPAVLAVLPRLLSGTDRFAIDARPDWRLFMYGFGAAAVSIAGLGRILARNLNRLDPLAVASAAGGLSTATARVTGTTNRLVAIQVTGATLLLLLAAALVRTLSVEIAGTQMGQVSGAALGWFDYRHNGLTEDRSTILSQRLLDLVSAARPFGKIAVASNVPGVGGDLTVGSAAADGVRAEVAVTAVSTGFFDATGMTLQRGRDFAEADIVTKAAFAVISDDVAAALWPDIDPVGRQFDFVDEKDTITRLAVVGIVTGGTANNRARSVTRVIFVPISRLRPNRVAMLARVHSNEAASVKLLRSVAGNLSPELAIEDVDTLQGAVNRGQGGRRASGTVLTAMGLLAALTAIVGVYGVVANLVTQRRRECGVLLSLGATRADVVRRLSLETAGVVVGGVVVGMLIAVPSFLMLRKYVWSLTFADWTMVSSVPLALAVAGIAAASVPVLVALRRPTTELLRG